jgi:hypothetical protein
MLMIPRWLYARGTTWLAAPAAGVVVVMVHVVLIDELDEDLEADEEEQEAQAGPRWRRHVDAAKAVATHSISCPYALACQSRSVRFDEQK